MNLGNTTGRQRKLAAPDKPKPGIFNVNDLHDWIIGGNVPDERVHLCPTFIKPYQFAPVKHRRIF